MSNLLPLMPYETYCPQCFVKTDTAQVHISNNLCNRERHIIGRLLLEAALLMTGMRCSQVAFGWRESPLQVHASDEC